MKNYAAKSAIWVLIALALPCLLLRAQDSGADVRSRILALEHARNQAEAMKDVNALDAILDETFVYVEFDGSQMGKAEFLARVRKAPLQEVVTDSVTTQIFGGAAIVTGIYRSTEVHEGKPLQRRGRFIDTWVYRNGFWVCVAEQATPITH
ncbi:MAG TPA: nuclear transport factor 2 family protein [Candidatus Sulfotelmatobacter sp.]|nr:nuclear transport factor 2 family protein [Candidatus Sulfotelmatobacter sp.]